MRRINHKNQVIIDGEVVTINDYVCFKDDIEQTGKLVKIEGPNLTIETSDGKRYIEHLSRVWIE